MKKILLILAITLVACRPEERVLPIAQAEEKLVLNSRIGADHSLFVAVTRTLPADQLGAKLGSKEWIDQIMVKDLIVIAEYQTQKDTLFQSNKGIYVLPNFHLSEGEYAHLSVYSNQGKRLLEAYTRAYNKPIIDKWNPLAKIAGNDTLCSISIELAHPSSDQAWYLIGLSKWSEDLLIIKNRKVSLSQVLGDRRLLQERAFLVSSEEFVNGHYEFNKRLPWLAANDTLLINIAKIDGAYKKYVEQQIKASNWLNQLIGESINLKSNILGGLGYFTLHKSETQYFIMQEHLR